MYNRGERMRPGNRAQSRPCACTGRQQSCWRQGKPTGYHRGLRAGHGFRGVNRELGRASRLLGSNSRSEGDRLNQHPGICRATPTAGEPNLAQAGRNTKISASTQGTGREPKADRPGGTEAVVATHSTAGQGRISVRTRGEPRPKGTHDNTRRSAGRQCRAWRRCQGKAGGTLSLSTVSTKLAANAQRAAAAMSPCGLVNCKVSGPLRAITDEPYDRIGHVRVCGGAAGAILPPTRQRTPRVRSVCILRRWRGAAVAERSVKR